MSDDSQRPATPAPEGSPPAFVGTCTRAHEPTHKFCFESQPGGVWCGTPVIPALGRHRLKDSVLRANLCWESPVQTKTNKSQYRSLLSHNYITGGIVDLMQYDRNAERVEIKGLSGDGR